MIHWKKNDGITLVELMVSITIGSLIMLAASTVLLLGLRVNHQTTEAVTQQYTARTVLTVLENMASEGSFDKVVRYDDGSWKVGVGGQTDNSENFSKVLLSYSAGDKAVYTGDYAPENSKGEPDESEGVSKGEPILENIVASYVIKDGNVLTISLEDKDQTYTSSVYCRTVKIDGADNFDSKKVNDDIEDSEDRGKFLTILASQVGMRSGIINHDKRPCAAKNCEICGSYNFFSQWYVGGYSDKAKAQGWSSDTPWCACFVSWGLGHIEGLSNPNTEKNPNTDDQNDVYIWFANVDDFMEYFLDKREEQEKQKNEQDKTTWWRNAGETPEIGDLIFFNMISDDKTNPSHMGAVLDVETRGGKTYISTIEGNSADMVVVREYRIDDSRIIGYGDPWAAAELSNDSTNSTTDTKQN